MSSVLDCFTHIDDLRKSEPDYFRPVSSNTSNAAPPPPPTTIAKTPVAFLDEGSRRIYGKAPDYQLLSEDLIDNVPKFVYSCSISGSKTEGEGKTKKLAKQRAAAAMLHVLIDKQPRYASSLGILSKTPKEAHDFVTKMAEEVFEPRTNPAPAETVEQEGKPVFNPGENYVGKVQELCVRCKLESAVYESKEEGPPNERTFITICKVAQEETEGRAKQKKLSKSMAAFEMFHVLEKGIAEMNNDFDVGIALDDDEASGDSTAKPKWEMEDPIKVVEETLADNSKFSNCSIDYKILENPCSFGLTQCMLKIKYRKNGETEITNIFPGAGVTEKDARFSAARMALVNLSTH